MALSQAKYQQILRSLTGQQAKVFDCIPISETWSFKQINAEVARRGVQLQWNQFQGCVNALKEGGLVKEPAPGMFMREPVRQANVITTEERPMPQDITTIKTKAAAPGASPTDRLAALAVRIRTMADVSIQLHHEAVKVADDLDNIALDIEENVEKNGEALKKLEAARETFKLLGLTP